MPSLAGSSLSISPPSPPSPPSSTAAAFFSTSTAAEKALRNAAFNGDLERLLELLDAGVDLDSTDKGGCTAVMKAAGEGHRECVDHLIAKGASLDAQSKSRQTALHFIAATKGDAPCAEALIKAGAKRNLKNVSGETALDIAKENGKAEVVRLLEDPTAYPRLHHYHQRCPTARPQWHARSEVEAREARRREAREARGEHAHACQCAPACSCTVS